MFEGPAVAVKLSLKVRRDHDPALRIAIHGVAWSVCLSVCLCVSVGINHKVFIPANYTMPAFPS